MERSKILKRIVEAFPNYTPLLGGSSVYREELGLPITGDLDIYLFGMPPTTDLLGAYLKQALKGSTFVGQDRPEYYKMSGIRKVCKGFIGDINIDLIFVNTELAPKAWILENQASTLSEIYLDLTEYHLRGRSKIVRGPRWRPDYVLLDPEKATEHHARKVLEFCKHYDIKVQITS